MWRKALSGALVLVAVATGCRSGGVGPDPVEPGPGADSAIEAVDRLVETLNIPDFEAASALAYPGQAALAALAEGATFGEVAQALEEGDYEVAANFWAGFAQGTGDFLTGSVTTQEGSVEEREGMEFYEVVVTPATGEERVVVTRDSEGHRIDLFASFGAGLATKMISPVERLLATETEDAQQILDALQGTVPSLLVAADNDGLSADATQALTRLVELITRSA